MDFSRRQADPRRHVVGIAAVILLHALVIYALITGLGKRVIDVIRAPIETKVIEEIKKPPPPPEVVVPPPPKMDAPPPPYIPPPEVVITAPAPPPTITAVTQTPPPTTQITPVAPPAAPAPPAPRPAVASIGVVCPQLVQPIMPRKALQEGTNGSVRARVTIRGGKVINVEILSSRPRGLFDSAVRNAMMQYGCQNNGDQETQAEQEFDFKITE